MAEPDINPNPIQTPAPADRAPLKPSSRAERVRAARGKFAFVPFSSEDHAREKEREIAREER